MRLRTINENFPPGAKDDPNAPYNEKSSKEKRYEFDSQVKDEDSKSHKVHVIYRYLEDKDGYKYIISYEYKFETKPKIESDYLDEIVRDLISDDIGDRYYEFK